MSTFQTTTVQRAARKSHCMVVLLLIVLAASGCKDRYRIAQRKPAPNDSLCRVDSVEHDRISAKDSLSLLETLMSQPGSLVVTEKFVVGERRFGKAGRPPWDHAESLLRVEGLVVYDAANQGVKLRGLRIGVGTDFNERNRFETTANKYCLVYISEIRSVVSNIDSMIVWFDKWQQEQKEESKVSFVTGGGFETTLIKRADEEILFMGCGGSKAFQNCYLQTTGDLVEVKTLLMEGESRLRGM